MPDCCKIECLIYTSANGLISVPVFGIHTSPGCSSGYLLLPPADAQIVLVMRWVFVRRELHAVAIHGSRRYGVAAAVLTSYIGTAGELG